MAMLDIIAHKRDGCTLSTTEIHEFITVVVNHTIPDYQTAALLMAIYLKRMTTQEQTTLTKEMMESGDQLDLSAIPGFKADLTEAAFINQVQKIGLAIVGATGTVAPADKEIYALRDVTATVGSIPLIASSIMSKKIASGTDALVIDVKTGAGAFMQTEADARKLAKALVSIGQQAGLQCMAVISDMNQPLGNKVGNTLEIEETLDALKGQGPADLMELVNTLGAQMLVLGHQAPDLVTARKRLEAALTSGRALAKFQEMIEAQGGDGRVVEDYSLMPHAKQSGVVTKLLADEIGQAAMVLRGGRQKADDALNYGVGIELLKKLGDPVKKGEALLIIHHDQTGLDAATALLDDAIELGETAGAPTLIHETIN
ncbi:thymidine phosphorylase [Limosilactobacillus fermentum]|nr:thymidine phosphorylase [Limosilactobacillus fermentum]